MQTHASAESVRNGPAAQRDINDVLAKFPEVASHFIQHHQTKVLGVGSAAVLDADIELFASDAVDGLEASSLTGLSTQQARLGQCLIAPLPLSRSPHNLAIALELMYLRKPIGDSHSKLLRKLEVTPQNRPQNRPVIAIAQASGAGKTKTALSAAMCAPDSTSASGGQEHPVALYALLASGSQPSPGVKACMECLTEIRQHFDPLIDNASLPVKSRFDLTLQLDNLYLRLYELFLFCFIRRATLLCQTIVNLRPAIAQPLSETLQRAILARQDGMGSSGLRVIALCRRVMPLSQFKREFQEAQASSDNELDRIPSSQYTFVGMYGLLDPPRAEVADAIQKAHIAGVRVAMLTGDHGTTALSIARQVHLIPKSVVPEEEIHTLRLAQDSLGRAVVEIVQNGKVLNTHVLGSSFSSTQADPVAKTTSEPRTYLSRVGAYVRSALISKEIEPCMATTSSGAVITGSDLRVFDDYLWDWALRHRYLVFARTTAEQKLKTVREAQKRHEVVAVTGDGVNDAPRPISALLCSPVRTWHVRRATLFCWTTTSLRSSKRWRRDEW